MSESLELTAEQAVEAGLPAPAPPQGSDATASSVASGDALLAGDDSIPSAARKLIPSFWRLVLGVALGLAVGLAVILIVNPHVAGDVRVDDEDHSETHGEAQRHAQDQPPEAGDELACGAGDGVVAGKEGVASGDGRGGRVAALRRSRRRQAGLDRLLGGELEALAHRPAARCSSSR